MFEAGPPIRLLLVEDEALVLMDERRILAQEGYEVLPFRRGDDAVETARNAAGIDMLITDIDLGPGIDGVEVARRIRGFKPMPVLFLSSSEPSALEDKARDLGGYAFLKKGFSKAALLEAVGKALSRRAAR